MTSIVFEDDKILTLEAYSIISLEKEQDEEKGWSVIGIHGNRTVVLFNATTEGEITTGKHNSFLKPESDPEHVARTFFKELVAMMGDPNRAVISYPVLLANVLGKSS